MQKVDALPWNDLETTLADMLRQYTGETFPIGKSNITMQKDDLLRAAAKYGKAVAHVTRMYRHLLSKGIPFELEVSVDETDTPTSFLEHYYVASELKRLGVHWVSLAPRFVGRFEKGVDYIGDLTALEKDLQGHAAIARLLGPYKLSLHSGSDKFSVYPLANNACQGLVHLKTAGTSYLEALRVVGITDPALFRKILDLGIQRYEIDHQTYHVSADIKKVPQPARIADKDLPGLLEQFDARQVFHVTFGSALEKFGAELRENLQNNEEIYYQGLEKHFIRHLRPFAIPS
jgi:tagaturonate epimerase